MALPKFLLQIRDGQTNTVYRWTTALAKRKDMRPITVKEAKTILEQQKDDREKKVQELFTDDIFEIEDDEDDENEITSNIDRDLTEDEKKPAEHPSFKTQDTIKADEYGRIEAFRKTSTLEAYLLEKYKFDMIPGTMDEMKSQAISFIDELASHGKLYAKLNE